jgi:hypothetical protein
MRRQGKASILGLIFVQVRGFCSDPKTPSFVLSGKEEHCARFAERKAMSTTRSSCSNIGDRIILKVQ